jgi:hypothetical protein
MKNTLTVAFTSAFMFVFVAAIYGDSPITSTPFSQAYLDVEMVKEAKEEGLMSLEIAEYLSSTSNPVDVKAAVINALSWDVEGKSNAELYLYYLALSYRTPIDDLDIDALNGDELFSLGYLTVMDDYFNPDEAIQLLEKASAKRRDSFTVSIVLALTKAQKAMESDWCEVWKLTDGVLGNKKLKQDLRPRARKIIVDYMSLYKDDCK